MREGIVRVLLKDSSWGRTVHEIVRIPAFTGINMKEVIDRGKLRIRMHEQVPVPCICQLRVVS
jgi:hypothetical protein